MKRNLSSLNMRGRAAVLPQLGDMTEFTDSPWEILLSLMGLWLGKEGEWEKREEELELLC